MAWAIPSLDLRLAAPLYFAGLFVACMVCHGELARLKPDPRHLTRFYLMLSLGGALGAVLVAIVAPLTLSGYFELGIALVALGAVLAVSLRRGWRWGAVAVTVVSAGFVRARRARLHRGRARDGARLLRRGAHRRPSQPGALPLDVPRRHHARRPAARRLVPQHAGGLLRPGLGLRPRVRLAARDAAEASRSRSASSAWARAWSRRG